MASTKFTQFGQASNTSETEISVGVKGGSNFKRLNNMTATTAPTATDDGSAGYTVGSTWFDITTGTLYVCSDSTNGAADWDAIGGIPLTGTAEGAPLTGIIYAVNPASIRYVVGDETRFIGYNADGEFGVSIFDSTSGAATGIGLSDNGNGINFFATDGTVSANMGIQLYSGVYSFVVPVGKIGFFNKGNAVDSSTQAAAIADATTLDVVDKFNTLLAAMRAYGLIAE